MFVVYSMLRESEEYAEADKARRAVIEEANKAESVCADTEKGTSSPFRVVPLLIRRKI